MTAITEVVAGIREIEMAGPAVAIMTEIMTASRISTTAAQTTQIAIKQLANAGFISQWCAGTTRPMDPRKLRHAAEARLAKNKAIEGGHDQAQWVPSSTWETMNAGTIFLENGQTG